MPKELGSGIAEERLLEAPRGREIKGRELGKVGPTGNQI